VPGHGRYRSATLPARRSERQPQTQHPGNGNHVALEGGRREQRQLEIGGHGEVLGQLETVERFGRDLAAECAVGGSLQLVATAR